MQDHDQRFKTLIREFFRRVPALVLYVVGKAPKDKAAWLGAEALRRISESPLPPQKKFLLGECVQAYLKLNEDQQSEYQKLIGTEKFAGVKAMNQTVYEKDLKSAYKKAVLK